METYSISEVEQLTGIKAHTLRIWEKRYNGLMPRPTATRIRYYDDEQLRNLLNISTLLRNGHKISRIMTMTDDEVNKHILQLSRRSDDSGNFEVYINTLVNHMLAFDEPSFDKTCSSIIIRFGMYEAILKVIYPFLRKTGVLWSTSNAAPAQEHFASNIIKRKLLCAIDGIAYPDKPEKKFLLFLPPDEWHEIALLVCDFMIRNAGAATIYLGQNLPFENLQTALKMIQPTHIVTFFTSGIELNSYLGRIADIAVKNGKPSVLVNTLVQPEGKYKNVVFLNSPGDLSRYL